MHLWLHLSKVGQLLYEPPPLAPAPAPSPAPTLTLDPTSAPGIRIIIIIWHYIINNNYASY